MAPEAKAAAEAEAKAEADAKAAAEKAAAEKDLLIGLIPKEVIRSLIEP